MHPDGYGASSADVSTNASTVSRSPFLNSQMNSNPKFVWDWDIEHEDRRREATADANMHGAPPFEVDRKVLKDVVREKMGVEVGRITFMNSGEHNH